MATPLPNKKGYDVTDGWDKYKVGLVGHLAPVTFGDTLEMVDGRLKVVRKTIRCVIVEVYEHHVVCEYDAPNGVKLRESYCKTDEKLRETMWRYEN